MLFKQIKYDTKEYWTALQMRERELRLPLEMRYSANDIKAEKDQTFFIAIVKGTICSTCQFVVKGSRAKMRQVATKKSFRGKGIGKNLYLFAEKGLKEKGVETIYCHARKESVSFYQSLNFELRSEEFEEIGIPHFRMERKIR